jgi:hypothetical protein
MFIKISSDPQEATRVESFLYGLALIFVLFLFFLIFYFFHKRRVARKKPVVFQVEKYEPIFGKNTLETSGEVEVQTTLEQVHQG